MQGVVVKKLWQHQPTSLLYRERREHVLYHFAVDITQIWLRSSDAKGSQLSGSVEKATVFQVQPKLLLKRKGESKTHQRRAFTFEFFTFLSGIRKLNHHRETSIKFLLDQYQSGVKRVRDIRRSEQRKLNSCKINAQFPKFKKSTRNFLYDLQII